MNEMQYYTEHLQCSLAEKGSCLVTVKKLYALAQLVRKDGMLTLEDAMQDEPDLFLKTAVSSLLELADYEPAKTCLYAYLMAGDYHGGAFLKNVLIVNGLLLILNNTNPITMIHVLKGWFGVEFAEAYQRELDAEVKRLNPKQPTPQSMVPDFDQLVSLTDAQAAQLISAVEARDLAIALKGAGDKIRAFLIGQLPEQEADLLSAYMESLANVRVKDVEAAQRTILKARKTGG